jgi:hypothetical protein
MEQASPVIHNLEEKKSMKKTFIFLIVLVLLGVGTGYAVAYFAPHSSSSSSQTSSQNASGGSQVKKGEIIGSQDKTYTDTAQGLLKKGGIDGEGAYHLQRPGGDSQNVYLTSSVLDLSKFEDRQIKVWGQTYQGDKAGWLMDVGRVQVLN